MWRRVLGAAVVLLLGASTALWLGRRGSPVQRGPAPAGEPAPVWEAARWQAGESVPDAELLALDGQTPVRMLARGANRPLILIIATSGSPALDRCASRWRELFEIYKDRVEFLTVFTAAPDSGGALSTVRVRPDASSATDAQALDAAHPRVEAAITFVTCNNWRIPVLVDGVGGAAAAQFGTEPQMALILDEARRRLGAPVAGAVPSDLDAVNGWLRHRFAP